MGWGGCSPTSFLLPHQPEAFAVICCFLNSKTGFSLLCCAVAPLRVGVCLLEGLPSLPPSGRAIVKWTASVAGGVLERRKCGGSRTSAGTVWSSQETSGEGDVPQTWPPGCRSPRDHPVGPQSTISASGLVWLWPSPLDSQPWQSGGFQKCLLGRTRHAWHGAERDGLCRRLPTSGPHWDPAWATGKVQGGEAGPTSSVEAGTGPGAVAVPGEAAGAGVTLSSRRDVVTPLSLSEAPRFLRQPLQVLGGQGRGD